jgi:hypothetical protein
MMQSIRKDIKKEHPSIQNTDIIAFFQVVQFVLAFQYHLISISKVKTGLILIIISFPFLSLVLFIFSLQ